jgi:hypothetical protein
MQGNTTVSEMQVDDMPTDYNKQRTAQEYARNSWPGTTGLSIIFYPSIGTYLGRPLTLWRTVPRSSLSNLRMIVSLLVDACIRSNALKLTDAQPVSTLSKPAGIFSAAPNIHSGMKSFSTPWVIVLSAITHSSISLSSYSNELEVLSPTNSTSR